MNRDDIREQFSPLLDGELTQEERLDVEAALAEDAELLRELGSLKRVDSLFRKLPRVEAPVELDLRVKHALRPKLFGFSGQSGSKFRLWPILASAATVLIVAGAGWLAIQSRAIPRATMQLAEVASDSDSKAKTDLSKESLASFEKKRQFELLPVQKQPAVSPEAENDARLGDTLNYERELRGSDSVATDRAEPVMSAQPAVGLESELDRVADSERAQLAKAAPPASGQAMTDTDKSTAKPKGLVRPNIEAKAVDVDSDRLRQLQSIGYAGAESKPAEPTVLSFGVVPAPATPSAPAAAAPPAPSDDVAFYQSFEGKPRKQVAGVAGAPALAEQTSKRELDMKSTVRDESGRSATVDQNSSLDVARIPRLESTASSQGQSAKSVEVESLEDTESRRDGIESGARGETKQPDAAEPSDLAAFSKSVNEPSKDDVQVGITVTVRKVGGREFQFKDGAWTEQGYDGRQLTQLVRDTKEFNDFIRRAAISKEILAMKGRLILKHRNAWYSLIPKPSK
jgi:hypothetical protein